MFPLTVGLDTALTQIRWRRSALKAATKDISAALISEAARCIQ
jgi:hypothetical protein